MTRNFEIKNMSTKKVLVAGATGYLGQYLVKELKKRNYWVKVLIRKAAQAEMFENIDEYFVGDITKSDSLIGVMEGVDWVFSTVGITRQKDGLTYMDVDYRGNANLLNEAEKANVVSFQYISAINGDSMRHLKIFEAKEKFVDALKSSKIRHCIMRPNGFFSDMQDFLKMAKGGRVYLFGHGNFKLNPIHGQDLANVCVDKMEQGVGQCTVGGPDILSHNELATMALNAWGKKIKIVHLPDWVRRFTISFMRLFTSSKKYGPIEFFLTAMAQDSIADTYGNKRLKVFFKETVSEMNN